MKITKIETLEIDLSGQNGLDLWRPIYVRIHTDEGISGMGEASLAYGTASEAIAPMIRILAERFLLGQDPNDTETLWEIMRQRSFWALGGGPVIFGAMSALDAALWDIKAEPQAYRFIACWEQKHQHLCVAMRASFILVGPMNH